MNVRPKNKKEVKKKKERESKVKYELKETKVKQEAHSCYSYSCTVKAWGFAFSPETQVADEDIDEAVENLDEATEDLDEVLRISNLLLVFMTFETGAR